MEDRIQQFDVSVGHRANPHRYEERALVSVTVRPLEILLGGCRIPQGQHLVEMPASVIPIAEAMVEEPFRLERARAEFDKAEAKFHERYGAEAKSDNSPSATFSRLFGEPPKPLDEFKVVEKGLPAPLTEQERQTAAVLRQAQPANDNGSRSRRGGNK